ncbi:MAG TPA: class I SAM-dependent methyltransferase, partial [Candidatus Polarisedimenticolaceae bacterium]|nr:class I SAM-dependent methyltransferase [Candidatus Polarisedimenticolaceae bacterium]
MTFKDHFSSQAGEYARFRPEYPAELFAWLAALAPGHELAWDCGTGSGQAALGLAAHFEAVLATDASAEQLRHARSHPRVRYELGSAERADLAAASVDLVVAAQALHWFAVDAFYAEAERVLRPAGVLAVWCYGWASVALEIDRVLDGYGKGTVEAYWPPERALIESGYRTLPFPYAEEPSPRCEIAVDWRLDELLGYLGSWSSTVRFRRERGEDPLPAVRRELERVWGPAGRPR